MRGGRVRRAARVATLLAATGCGAHTGAGGGSEGMRALAHVAESARDASAQARQQLSLARTQGRQAIGRVAPAKLGQPSPGAEERSDQRAKEAPGQDEERVQAAHAISNR